MDEKNIYPITQADHQPGKDCWCHPVVEVGDYTEIHHQTARQIANQRDIASHNAERWQKLAQDLQAQLAPRQSPNVGEAHDTEGVGNECDISTACSLLDSMGAVQMGYPDVDEDGNTHNVWWVKVYGDLDEDGEELIAFGKTLPEAIDCANLALKQNREGN